MLFSMRSKNNWCVCVCWRGGEGAHLSKRMPNQAGKEGNLGIICLFIHSNMDHEAKGMVEECAAPTRDNISR